MKHRSSKSYGHDLGLSCAFRQWRAESHCRFAHGYALGFVLTFEAAELDACGWVMDFGALRPVKAFLAETFDHKTVMAEDDPGLPGFKALANEGLLDLVVLDRVGCEAFAGEVARWVSAWLERTGHAPRVRLVSVVCREHGANAAEVVL